MNTEKEMSGVVLIGGKSTRMGSPKALLSFHGQPFFMKIAGVLSVHFSRVYLSHRPEVFDLPNQTYPVLEDSYETISPMTGILSSLELLQVPIFVVPTDMPTLQSQGVKKLLNLRNPNEICTVFFKENEEIYEPLFGVWEVIAIPFLQNCIATNSLSFQKLLRSQNVTKHFLTEDLNISNVNTLDEYTFWKKTNLT